MKHEKMEAWMAREDEKILSLVATEGPKWSKIALELPGRSVASVRNRYLRIQKGVKKRAEGTAKNRCHACERRSAPHISIRHPAVTATFLSPGGLMKLGHVCHAKDAGGPFVPIRKTAPRPPVVVTAEGPAAMFSAVESLDSERLLSSRSLDDLESAYSSGSREGSASTVSTAEPMSPTAPAILGEPMPSPREPGMQSVNFATASTLASTLQQRVVVPLSAVQTPPDAALALGRQPSQEEEAAHQVLMLKKNPAVRQEFA